jgi:hypothetical protein
VHVDGAAALADLLGQRVDPAERVTPLNDLGRSCSLIFLTGGGG